MRIDTVQQLWAITHPTKRFIWTCGPIQQGKSALDHLKGRNVYAYAYKLHAPKKGKAGVTQMYDVHVGTYWALIEE